MKQMRIGFNFDFKFNIDIFRLCFVEQNTERCSYRNCSRWGNGCSYWQGSGNTALGAIIGAAVGGATGAVIGHQMDKQAEEIKKTVPDAKVERVGEGIVVEFSSNVLFAFDKSDLSADSKINLHKLVTVLDSYPDTDIEVQGHTDSKGSESYNMSLSERRANAVYRLSDR